MIHQVFTCYDCKAEIYLLPFYCQTKGQAIRMFDDSSNDPSHQFFKHPEDFVLFQLGTYDDGIGVFDLYDVPIVLGRAIEFKKQLESANTQISLVEKEVSNA